MIGILKEGTVVVTVRPLLGHVDWYLESAFQAPTLQQEVVPLRRYPCCSRRCCLCEGIHVEPLLGRPRVEACWVVPGRPRVEAVAHAAAGGGTFEKAPMLQ